MDFLIGCNYWASHAGTEMWRNWDENIVRKDLEVLSSHGVECMRVFPNWRDFQPVIPIFRGNGALVEYRLEGDRKPENPDYLDEVMLERFSVFCDLCDEYNIKLIVGLLTGWMSGRLFTPSLLFEKDLYKDPTALLFEQRFIRGFVSRFKERKTIYAWDLGNECNCMWWADNEVTATNWTAIISNTIRAYDNTRPVVSGMHTIVAEKNEINWTISGQSEFCDILTTHPYPIFVEYAYKDKMMSYRTLMHATCETKYYSDRGGKPCLVEEVGTLGPTFCSEENAGSFMHLNLFSNWANGAEGVMWWCANDFTNLTTPPYTYYMCEIELGMSDTNLKPKPVLEETKKVSDVLHGFNFKLPKAKEDAVCILTQSQRQWGVAYMTYCLAKQAGLNIRFTFSRQELPQSDCYIMPSIAGYAVMPRENYLELKKRVWDGATLYISCDNGRLAEYEDLTGMHICDTGVYTDTRHVNFAGADIEFTRNARFELESAGAEVLAYDSEGCPVISAYNYGKGKVYYVNFPLESMLLNKNDAFDSDNYKIYSELFADKINEHQIITDNKNIGVTIHESDDEVYCVAINYSDKEQIPEFKIKGSVEIVYGNLEKIAPFDALIIKLK